MSAAEKLKALESAGWYAVLPQIVAVVEAATEMGIWLEMQSSNSYGRDLIPIRDFDAALAALDETLGDLGSAPESETPTPPSERPVYSDADGKPFDPQPIREPLGDDVT